MTPFRVIDGRELQPPEPLFNFLARHGYRWTVDIADDGTHTIRIEHADAC